MIEMFVGLAILVLVKKATTSKNNYTNLTIGGIESWKR